MPPLEALAPAVPDTTLERNGKLVPDVVRIAEAVETFVWSARGKKSTVTLKNGNPRTRTWDA
jgi:hypothetical protein